jgi:hypothetical protein
MQIFCIWLALHHRLNTNDRLSRKGITSNSRCPFECSADESIGHLFRCPRAISIWQKLLIQNPHPGQSVPGIITNSSYINNHKPDWVAIFIAIAWNLWLARNKKVFDEVDLPLQQIATNCRDYPPMAKQKSENENGHETSNQCMG